MKEIRIFIFILCQDKQVFNDFSLTPKILILSNPDFNNIYHFFNIQSLEAKPDNVKCFSQQKDKILSKLIFIKQTLLKYVLFQLKY